jgi:transmembrane sensor
MADHMDMERPIPDWEDLARYLAGEGSSSDRANIEAFLRQHPEDAELLRGLDAMSRRVRPAVPVGLDVEAALIATMARRTATPVVSLDERRHVGRRPVLLWAGLAAAAAVAFLLGRGDTPGTAPGPDVVYRGTPGRIDSVRLADGSVAVLAPNAELSVPRAFPKGARTVRLKGQGWFRASHDESSPFTVVAGEAVVRDVGTVFSIQSLEGGAVHVAVHEGSVAVRGGEERGEVMLGEGDETSIVAGRAQAPSRGSVGARDADWTSGQLHFRDVSMEEFCRTVSSWTGWVVRLDDPELRVLRVTQDLTLAEARQRFEEAARLLGAGVRWSGDTAVVSMNGGR